MDIHAAKGRHIQNVLGQNTAVGHHHDQLRGQRLYQLQGRAVPQLSRLIHSQAL